MTRKFYALLAVLVPFLGVLFLTSTAFGQQSRIFIPQALQQAMPQVGILTCTDWDNDGVDENLFALSKRVFANGTPLSEIRKHYKMLPDDFGKINNKFFPSLVVNSATGQSGVCLPTKYNVQFVDVTGDVEKDFILRYKDGVPNWESNLWYASEVQVSGSISETFTAVMAFVGLETVWGAPVVGTIERGGQIWGQIIKHVPGSLSAQAIGKALGGFVLADALFDRFYEATTMGVVYPATVLNENGAGIFYYSVEAETAYLRCFLGEGEDAVSVAENLLVPNVIRLYTPDNSNNGCVVARVPLGGIMGDTPYPWDVVEVAVLDAIAKRQKPGSKPITEADMAEIMKNVEKFFEDLPAPGDPEDPARPVPFPADPSLECPQITGGQEADLISEAIMFTVSRMEEMLRNADPDQLSSFNNLIEFTNAIQEVLPDLEMEDFYAGKRPRNEMYNFAHLSNQLSGADAKGRFWTVEAVCLAANGKFEWIINVSYGRLRSSVTSTMWYTVDLVYHYPFRYWD